MIVDQVAAFTTLTGTFTFDDGTNSSARERIGYAVTSLSLAPVPVPTGLPLLRGGVAGLAWLRTRRRS
jgi:hypothetical protein